MKSALFYFILVLYLRASMKRALFCCSSAHCRVLFLINTDDMIITGDDSASICLLKDFLSSQFDMKDLGSLRYFLGIEVAYSPHGNLLS